MTTTVFVNGVTLSDDAWFNDVDAVTYDGTTSQILVGAGAGTVATWTTATGTGSPVRGTSPSFTTSVISASTTLAVFNTVATTLNIGGAATTITLGAATGTVTIGPAIVGSITTDSTSPTTGAWKTAGGLGVAKALWVGGLANIAGLLTAQNGATIQGTITTTLGGGTGIISAYDADTAGTGFRALRIPN